MELTTEQIEQAEDAFYGRLNAEEQASWASSLAASPALAEEVQRYQQLWSGFAAQANQDFSNRMPQLDEEQAQQDDEELVDWYYRGLLGSAQIARVEARASRDLTFGELMTSSKALYEGFEKLRSNAFRAQMADWEKKQADESAKVVPIQKKRSPLRWLAVAASVLLVLGFGLRFYAAQNYNTNKLVADAQVEPRTGSLMAARGAEEDPLKTLKEDIQSAYAQLERGNYEAAQTAFTLLATRVQNKAPEGPRRQALLDNLAWNSLLAQIASAGMTENNRNRLEAYASNAQFNYREQAKELLEQTGSFWYRIGQ
ncbi:MAG: hypothetical protein AAF840_15120 [Bacteroidota bacterium]